MMKLTIMGAPLLALLINFSARASTFCDMYFLGAEMKEIAGGWVAQRRACFSGGECFFLEKKFRQRTYNSYFVKRVLGSDGIIIADPAGNDPSINCHSYALRRIGVPLPPHSWVNADHGYFDLLKRYFVNSGQRYSAEDARGFEFNFQIQEGDLVLMSGRDRVLNHSGVVVRRNGRNWVQSKLDEDEVVLTPLYNLLGPYQVGFISVWRLR